MRILTNNIQENLDKIKEFIYKSNLDFMPTIRLIEYIAQNYKDSVLVLAHSDIYVNGEINFRPIDFDYFVFKKIFVTESHNIGGFTKDSRNAICNILKYCKKSETTIDPLKYLNFTSKALETIKAKNIKAFKDSDSNLITENIDKVFNEGILQILDSIYLNS